MTSHCASEVELSSRLWRYHVVIRRKRLLCDVIFRHKRRSGRTPAASLSWRHNLLWRNHVIVEVWRNFRAVRSASRILPVFLILVQGEFLELGRFGGEGADVAVVTDVVAMEGVVAMQHGSVRPPSGGFWTGWWDWWYFWGLLFVVTCLQVTNSNVCWCL